MAGPALKLYAWVILEYINYFKNNTKNDEDVILYRKRNKYKRKLVNLYNEFITKYNVKKCKHRTHTLIDIMLKNEKTKNDDRLLKLVKKFKSIESDIRILSKKNGYDSAKKGEVFENKAKDELISKKIIGYDKLFCNINLYNQNGKVVGEIDFLCINGDNQITKIFEAKHNPRDSNKACYQLYNIFNILYEGGYLTINKQKMGIKNFSLFSKYIDMLPIDFYDGIGNLILSNKIYLIINPENETNLGLNSKLHNILKFYLWNNNYNSERLLKILNKHIKIYLSPKMALMLFEKHAKNNVLLI